MEVDRMNEEEKENLEQVKTIDIEELVEGKSIFRSNGIACIKVTKDNEERILRIPIQSSGVNELIEDFTRDAPLPPVINKLIQPDDPMGRELRLTRKKWMQVHDFADVGYLKSKEKHDSDLGLKVVLKGIAIPIKDGEGNVVEDENKKLDILRGMGLTGEQMTKLFNDIRNLTRIAEDEETDFLE